MKWIALVLILFLVGCTTPQSTCPTVSCPPCEETQDDAVEQEEEFRVEKVLAGKEHVYFVIDKEQLSVIDCGTEARGPVISGKIADFNKNFNTLVVTEDIYTKSGGCRDIIRDYPDLLYIELWEYEEGKYEEILRWAKPDKIITIKEQYDFSEIEKFI